MTAHRGPAWLYVRNPRPEVLTRRVALGKALGWLCAHPGCRQATITARAWCWTHDVDEVAVWRATQGDPVPLYRHERVEVLERLRRGHRRDSVYWDSECAFRAFRAATPQHAGVIVVGENAGSKLSKAQSLGVRVVSEPEFAAMLGLV